ncbi:MAG: alanine racemase [Desulfitobacteriaceae bacterium]
MIRAWIDIDMDTVLANYREVLNLLQPGSRCMAVVKADGYGLGAVEMARALEAAGCEAFAVTHVEEGLILRRQGIKGLILVLGPSAPEDWAGALRASLQLTLADYRRLVELERVALELGLVAQVHLKLETGMGRTGFVRADLDRVAAFLREAPHIEAVGIYTHFARAGQRDHVYNRAQYEKFAVGLACLEALGVCPRWKHIGNSAVFLDHPEWHFDFVRVGTLLIGHLPGPGFVGRLNLRDPWSAKCQVMALRKVPAGTYVGYQSIYRVKRETQLAVIPIGYADGFGVEPRLIPQGGVDLIKIIIKNIALFFGVSLGQDKVTLRGRTIRIAGKIGMQLTVLDVGLEECSLGDEVSIPLRRASANPRLLRRYWAEGRIFAERRLEEGFLPLNPEQS